MKFFKSGKVRVFLWALGGKTRLLLVLFVCIIVVACGQDSNKKNDEYTTWKEYGGGPSSSKYIKENSITQYNVNQLKVAWFYSTHDNKSYQFNPIVVDSVMYVLAKNNSLVALNATTGKEIWIHTDLQGIEGRGINYWESSSGKDKRLIFQMNDYLQEIDARTGKSIISFGSEGVVDLRKGLGRNPKDVPRIQSDTPGKIFKNLIILGASTGEEYMAPPGFIRAYNVITGKRAWTFHTIPQPGEFGYDTWPKDAYKYIGGVNTWGEMSIDKNRGIVYCPVGSPTYDYYGADRIGKNLFSDCLVALDANTGKRLWHFQMTHHDLWDYDPTAAPQLITVNHDRMKVDAVAQATKQGFLFVFNRVTGKPLWPIKEKPVPPSHVSGEQAWPTQPYPTVVPPFTRQNVTPDDVSPLLTKKERIAWKNIIDTSQTGLYTPLSDKHPTVAMPGAVGGANWGKTASNPDKGIVYVNTINLPSFYSTLRKKRKASSGGNGQHNAKPFEQGRNIFMKDCQSCHGANRRGSGPAPSLINLGNKVSIENFKQIVNSGRGQMPSFSYLSDSKIRNLYKFLAGTHKVSLASVGKKISGPVVASGGAPGGQKNRHSKAKGGRFGPPYPRGVDAPSQRYYIKDYGLNHLPFMPPPWSTIIAYDLNKGTIKWRRPIGNDTTVSAKGDKDTGVWVAQQKGMIVTSTGVLFSTAGDGKVYAFNADNGKQLWSAKLPMGAQGLPAMYEVTGRYYLVISATSPVKLAGELIKPSNKGTDETNVNESYHQGGYVVFELPK